VKEEFPERIIGEFGANCIVWLGFIVALKPVQVNQVMLSARLDHMQKFINLMM